MAATLHHIAGLVLNRPLLLLPSKLDTIAAVLSGRIGIDASGLSPEASRFVGSYVDQDPATGARTGLPYRRTADGVALIPVIGSLVTPTVTNTSRQPGASGSAQAGSIDWDAIADEMNAKAGLHRGPNAAAIYASRRAAAGQQPVTQASPSHSRSGVDVTAIYASRQEQAVASQSASASDAVDWGEIADRMNAKAGLQRGPNPSSIYGQRKAQVESDR